MHIRKLNIFSNGPLPHEDPFTVLDMIVAEKSSKT